MTVTSNAQMDRQLEAYLAELRAQFGPECLVNLTLNAVQAIDQAGLQPLIQGNTRWETNPRTILTILTHCYGIGLYNPSDIETAIERDPVVSYLAARRYPTAAVLRRFRREHRALLQQALVNMFQRVWAAASLGFNPQAMGPAEWEAALEQAAMPPGLELQLSRLAVEHILLAQLWDGPALRD